MFQIHHEGFTEIFLGLLHCVIRNIIVFIGGVTEVIEAFPIPDSWVMIQKRVTIFMTKRVPGSSPGLQDRYENFSMPSEISFPSDAWQECP